MPGEAFQSLTTAEVPAPSRLARWNEFGSETLSDIRVDPLDPDGFTGSLSRVRVDSLGLGWLSTGAARCTSGSGRVGAWAAPEADAFLLILQEAGRCGGLHLGRESLCGPGDLVLLDAARSRTTEAPGPSRMTIVKLPVDTVLGVLGDPEAVCGVRLAGEAPEVAAAGSLLLGLRRAVQAEPLADWNGAAQALALEALAMLFGEASPAETRSAGLRREAYALIERRLADPGLGVEAIAEALGVSVRSVQRLFMGIGATPNRYILDRRLQAAAEQLRRPAGASITEVAYGLGFNDLSYFTRSFRKKLGVSPRQYRRLRVN